MASGRLQRRYYATWLYYLSCAGREKASPQAWSFESHGQVGRQDAKPLKEPSSVGGWLANGRLLRTGDDIEHSSGVTKGTQCEFHGVLTRCRERCSVCTHCDTVHAVQSASGSAVSNAAS